MSGSGCVVSESLPWVGSRVRPMALLSGLRQQAMASEDVVCEGEPAQHAENLFTAADEELTQAPVAEVGIDAFARSTSLVDTFAVRAFHPSSPSSHFGTVFGAWRIGIGIVLAPDRRSIHLYPT